MRAIVALFALFLASAASANDPNTTVADYTASQKWEFSTAPIAVPAGGLRIVRDVGQWELRSGSLRLMKPSADGRITGLVFEGDGRFTMTVPDRFELAQLRRLTEKADLQSIDTPFTELVLRVSDRTINNLPGVSAVGDAAPLPLAQRRHEIWLIDQNMDVDARVAAAALDPGALIFTADTHTRDFGWLTFDFDSYRSEEVRLISVRSSFPEIWISLDRAEERRSDGRPRDPAPMTADIQDISVVADLTRTGHSAPVGRNWQKPVNGHYRVTETVVAHADLTSLRMQLMPKAQALRITTEDGVEIPCLRDRIGARSARIENDVYNDELIAILPVPMKANDTRRFVFEYDLETMNFALGGAWYPVFPESFRDTYTARMDLTVRKGTELRSMGKLESTSTVPAGTRYVWVVAKPTKMVTFTTADRVEEVRVEASNIPPVISFAPSYQFDNRDKVRNVAADVANSMQFFQALLNSRIEAEQFYVTSIAAGHGQAFDGFLHLSEYTYTGEHPGASELFRAHEVAHEWFGHKVGWKSYRDQWLSEGLAEYASILFVASFVKGGPGFMEEILDSYEGVVHGNLSGGFSKFTRPALVDFSSAHRNRLGPIGHGYRASTAEMKAGYIVQTYYKAPLVLQMLRSLLRAKTGNDQMFMTILRDYVAAFDGKDASTDDFRSIVEKDAPGDWKWFFDSWIYGADIPSYTWSYTVTPGNLLTIHLKRSGTAPDFTTAVPILLEYEDGRGAILVAMNRTDDQVITQQLNAKPKNVVLGPQHSLLARIKRE